MQIIMTVFALIDWMIYSMVSLMFELIFLIAEVDIFKQETISMFANRVYGVLGVIILFKIVISCIEYLINPDKLVDKEKGMAGLLTRTIISIALLAFVPTIFTFAKKAQVIISEAIPAIIIGREVNADNTEDIKETGKWMSFQTLSTFIKVKDDKKLDSDEGINDFDSFLANITAGCGFFAPSECKYTYQFVFSIPVGIFMLYILLSMGIDIAIRSIKLGILQLLAPIPVASYINNDKSFKAWYSTCFSVYTDLFVRLIIIYFVIFLISIIANNQVSLGDNVFVWIYMIIALLMFAKSAPGFITKALGLPEGAGNIGDMFKRGGALAGTTLGAAKTAFSNYVTQDERFKSKNASSGRRVIESLKSAAAGAASATGRGLLMAAQGKGFKDVKQGVFKDAISARNRRIDRADNLYNREKYQKDARGRYILDENGNKIENPDYYTYKHAMIDRARNNLGIPSNQEFIKTRYDVMEQTSKAVADAKGHGAGKMNETPSRYKISIMDDADGRVISNVLGYDELSMGQVRELYSIAKNGGQLQTADGSKVTLTNAQLESLGQVVQNIEKRTSYLKEAELMAIGDPAATTSLNKLRMMINNNKTMYNSVEIMKPVIEKMAKYNLSVNTISDVLVYMEELDRIQNKMPSQPEMRAEPIAPKKPSNYDTDVSARQSYDSAMSRYEYEKADYEFNRASYEQEYKNAMEDYEIKYNAWRKEVDYKANIINGIKDSFEEIAKREYPAAQVAQSRAEKARKASENDKNGK